MSLICIPIQAKSIKELKQKIKKAEPKADLLEIWVDSLKEKFSAPSILRSFLGLSRKPLIIVNKSRKENGQWQGSEKSRLELLAAFIKANAAYTDIAIGTNPQLIKTMIAARGKNKIILSYHDFKTTPPLKTLQKILHKGFTLGADIVKIATTARKPEDNLIIFNLLAHAQRKKLPVIAHCMGRQGKISRIMSPLFGSYLTFVALDQQNKTASGQLTLQEYLQFKKYLENI